MCYGRCNHPWLDLVYARLRANGISDSPAYAGTRAFWSTPPPLQRFPLLRQRHDAWNIAALVLDIIGRKAWRTTSGS